MTDDEKRGALLADRVVGGLATLPPDERRKVLTTLRATYCHTCGNETKMCTCTKAQR